MNEIDIQKHARALCAVRALRGWTQVELAERMSTTPETISAIESGRRNSQRYAPEVCEATGIRLGEFDLLLDIYVNSERRLVE